jgi:hypothetical protein
VHIAVVLSALRRIRCHHVAKLLHESMQIKTRSQNAAGMAQSAATSSHEQEQKQAPGVIASVVVTSSSAHRLVLHVLGFLVIPAACLFTHYRVWDSDEAATRLTKVHTCTHTHAHAYMHSHAHACTHM